MPSSELIVLLSHQPARRDLVNHAFFQRVKQSIDRASVARFLGQWWHPLHYFPTFLARCISVLPDIESKSAIAKILYQETGQGDGSKSHEMIFVESMRRAGFSEEETTGAERYVETQKLVEGYERAANDRLTAVGSIFATEVVDLAMVSGVGDAIMQATGVSDIEWVNIHIQEEPDHVEKADEALAAGIGFGQHEEAAIIASAQEMWQLWTHFFDRLERDLGEVEPASAQAHQPTFGTER